ncbi:MAG: c-type cytochrome [Bdellovibrionaceae bacterium]|nr:c-type cytochrome [Pseudobdellovibrionaceae bacterium]
MKHVKQIILTGLATLTLVSMVLGCDNGGAHRDVVPNVVVAKPVGKGDCVPFATVSKAIFEPKCKSCHGDGSPIKNWLDHGIASQFTNNILDKVSNNPPKMGGAVMPMGGSLSADEIALLKSWIDGGAQKVCATEPVKAPGDGSGSAPSNSPTSSPANTPSNAPVNVPAPTTIADTCIGCHGANGGGVSEDFPNLAGLSVAYIEKQLRDFRSGERVDAMMGSFAQGLKDDEIAKLAEYFSKMKPVEPPVVVTGNAPADVAVCTSCHGSGGMANATAMPGVPNLAGQKATYIVKQLKLFKTQNRKDATMSAFAGSLSDAQIEAIAKYFSGLKPVLPAAAP